MFHVMCCFMWSNVCAVTYCAMCDVVWGMQCDVIVMCRLRCVRCFRLVRARGGVCVMDEVATGLGRIGTHTWAFEVGTPPVRGVSGPLGTCPGR